MSCLSRDHRKGREKASGVFSWRCPGMATAKTCPHGLEKRVSVSGTQVREMVQRIEVPPPEDSRREVAAILLQWATPPIRI